MVFLLQLFFLLPLSHVCGNSHSLLTTHSNHKQTHVIVKKTDHALAASAGLEVSRPFLHGFYGKGFITPSRVSNQRTERHPEDTLSAEIPHSSINGSKGQIFISPKNRIKRGPNQNASQEEQETNDVIKSSTDDTVIDVKKDLSTVGSDDVTIAEKIALVGSSTENITSPSKNAQYRPQSQTAHGVLESLTTAPTNPTFNTSLQTNLSATVARNEKLTSTTNRMIQLNANRTLLEKDRPAITIPTRTQPRGEFTTLRSDVVTTSLSTSITNLQLEAPLPGVDVISFNHSQPKNTLQSTSSTKISTDQSSDPGTKGTVTDIKNTRGKPTFQRTTSSLQIGHGHFVFENDRRFTDRDQSISVGTVPSLKSNPASPTRAQPSVPCGTGVGPCVSYKDEDKAKKYETTNGSFLVWADLKRTLSFAWELHVFGSAALFLLLTAGSILGLVLAPSLNCPHCGELILTNSLLLFVGVIRAGHFLLDPYGTRLLLPPPVIIALYTLPLPLLILAQAALVILVLKEAGVTWLPPAFQRPPLLGVLAVLQCTLLLAADLLSPALSPAVPVVLQSLMLIAGLALCFGYLFLALPRLPRTREARGGNKGTVEGKVQVLARVLVVCALLGILCCLLHIYACLWLYGLLGDWRRFRWGWWLCQFWVRLLELAWAFCLLLVSSWVFWRPNGGHICGAPRQEGVAPESLPSPTQSSNSSSRHTCWAKIVQSLKVRQQRKSESNGIGGSNSGTMTGELPNNWAGQERSGADISKSLIRNRDPLKDSNHGRNLKSFAGGSAGSLLRLQALAQTPRSLSNSLDRDKESAVSLCDFDLRPPTPIDLTRSIDEALNREHLFMGESLFHPLRPVSPPPSPDLWMRRNSDPQITLSLSSDEHTLLTESSAGLDRSIPSTVPSRQVTAPPTPTHQGFRWVSEVPVPSSLSCPVSLHPSPSTSHALIPSAENTRPFLTPDFESSQSNSRGGRSYLKVTRNDDSASVSSDIIDL